MVVAVAVAVMLLMIVTIAMLAANVCMRVASAIAFNLSLFFMTLAPDFIAYEY